MSIHRPLLAAAAALTLALPGRLPAQYPAQAYGDTSAFRPLDLPAPNQYRSGSGAPGPRYWQQRADYRIEATLDTVRRAVRGAETIRYHNASPDTLRFLWLQVDQNLYRPGSLGSLMNEGESRWGARDFAGGMDVQYARVDGADVEPYVYDTMMRLDLARPLAPGQTAELAVGWSFLVPEHGSDRMARDGNLYEMAQWFPRMAVYDDVSGWNTDPYLGQGEFYLEYGDYDVALTVPANYVIGATGVLRNPEEVLTAAQRERLARAAKTDDQVAIIPAAEAGTAAARPRATGTLTWRFHAENVHDFAWAGSPDFRWDSEAWNGVQCHALYEPEATAWRTAADMTCFSIREFSRWFPYPYPQATSVAGPVGGMEYPMFVMVHGEGSEEDVFGTIAHEQGHEWFPMIVGSNERRYAWMDEGFNTFIDTWANDTRYPGSGFKENSRRSYGQIVASGDERPIITPPDRIPPAGLGATAYRKPATVLHMLRDQVLGPEAFDAAFRAYAARWAFKHPTPADFFRTMEDVSGRDLDWFWREWIYGTDVLDLSVAGVENVPAAGGAVHATVRLRRNTSVVMPVTLRLRLANGETRDVALPEQIWFGGPTFDYRVEVPAEVVGAVLDPMSVLADVRPDNNRWGR